MCTPGLPTQEMENLPAGKKAPRIEGGVAKMSTAKPSAALSERNKRSRKTSKSAATHFKCTRCCDRKPLSNGLENIRVDSYHRGNSATTPLESHDEAPLTLRIENVISINPDLAQDNASALSWKVKASDKENPEHLCQAEITPFCLKGGESDDSLAQSRKRKRNES